MVLKIRSHLPFNQITACSETDAGPDGVLFSVTQEPVSSRGRNCLALRGLKSILLSFVNSQHPYKSGKSLLYTLKQKKIYYWKRFSIAVLFVKLKSVIN